MHLWVYLNKQKRANKNEITINADFYHLLCGVAIHFALSKLQLYARECRPVSRRSRRFKQCQKGTL